MDAQALQQLRKHMKELATKREVLIAKLERKYGSNECEMEQVLDWDDEDDGYVRQ